MESLRILLGKLKDGTFREIIDDWKWIFSYSKRYKKAIAFYIFLGVFSTTFSLISSIASKKMIDIVTGYQAGKLLGMAIVMVGMALFSLLFSSLISRISTKISIFINNDIQADIFDKIMDANWMSITRYSNGDILNRFNSDVSIVANNAVSWLPTVIINVYNFIAVFAVILYYDVTMAFIALGSAPFLLISSRYLMNKMRDYSKKAKEMSSQLMTFEAETFYNIDTIKSFGITGRYGKELRGWQGKLKKYNLDYNMFSIKTNIALSIIGMLVEYLAFGYCVYKLFTHQISYGTMTLFLSQRSRLSSAFSSLVSIIPSMLNSSVSAGRIRELVELPKEEHIKEGSAELEEAIASGFTVKMDGVSFAYVENNKVLTNSDFIARPNEIVALVGPSGEGKTTMIRMILGLISPDLGTADIIDCSGNKVKLNSDTRRYFAYVPQGNTILSGTIAENMRMVKENATDEEIIEALKIACAYEFVERIPEGINGKIRERGRGMSEGQAQRIAIARAVLRDAPILLLDEATSALDVETERRVLKNIVQQRPNKTCIVTTHRPSVLNLCQRVYRVMDTKVTELDEETSSKMVMDF